MKLIALTILIISIKSIHSVLEMIFKDCSAPTINITNAISIDGKEYF
jgi:hypothetical protein